MNPLSFSVGVKDEASKQLEKINAELNNLVSKLDSIKNIAISLGGDPGEAESLMKSLNGVAASLSNISRLSPEAQAASDKLTDSQQKLNAAMEQYNDMLAKIKASNPTQVFLDATKGLTGVSAGGWMSKQLKETDPKGWAELLKDSLNPKFVDTKDIESNVNKLVANIRQIMSSSLSDVFKGKGNSLSAILEEGFDFNTINQKLNERFAKLRKAYIKGIQEIQDVKKSGNGAKYIAENVLPGLKAQAEAAQKEFEALKNSTSSTPVNP